MPRRKFARRFEPRFGVSQPMLEQETSWLNRELDDLLIDSTTDLRERLGRTQQQLLVADANVQLQMKSLPQRENLAIRCLLARDLYHLSALYEQFFRIYQGEKHTVPTGAVQEATETAQSSPPPAPGTFKEWLFAQ